MLKEDWKATDKFNYNNYNEIITDILQLCETHKINLDITRKIKIGDNLSGRKIFINFEPREAFDNFIATQGNNVDIIKTENSSIFEEIYYSAGFYKTVSTNDYTELFEYYEGDYQANNEPSINLKELVLSNNFGIVNYININSYFYNNITIKKELLKVRGELIDTDDLNRIENILNTLCSQFYFSYKKRNWYKLSVISYKDINRWCKTINMLNKLEINKYSKYISDKYNDLYGKTYKELLYKEANNGTN